jgi:protein-S-isoprenylcysteine O-methyltransferase Ste14
VANQTLWKLIIQFIATVIIPLTYLYNILIIIHSPSTINLPVTLRLIGIIVAICGLIFWIISFINLGKSFGVLPQKQKKIKRGLYQYFSHPMYVGIWSCFLGLSLANASWQGLVFLNLLMTPLLFVRARLEDKNLIN